MVALRDIEEFAKRVARAYKPERIILFGSHAYGEPNEDSDVDILVVLPFEGKSWRMASQIRRETRPAFPLDLIVRTPEQLAERLGAGDAYFSEVTTKGKVLYAA